MAPGAHSASLASLPDTQSPDALASPCLLRVTPSSGLSGGPALALSLVTPCFPPSPLLRVLPFLECPLSSSTSRIFPDQSSKTPVKVCLPLKTSLKAPAVANFVSLWRESYGLYHIVQHTLGMSSSYWMMFHMIFLLHR